MTNRNHGFARFWDGEPGPATRLSSASCHIKRERLQFASEYTSLAIAMCKFLSLRFWLSPENAQSTYVQKSSEGNSNTMNTENPYKSPSHAGKNQVNPSAPANSIASAPCPSCQNAFAKPIKFTFWGGAFGPRLFSHAKCTNCGTKFNFKTGKSNLMPIVIYNIVGFVVGVIAFVVAFSFFS